MGVILAGDRYIVESHNVFITMEMSGATWRVGNKWSSPKSFWFMLPYLEWVWTIRSMTTHSILSTMLPALANIPCWAHPWQLLYWRMTHVHSSCYYCHPDGCGCSLWKVVAWYPKHHSYIHWYFQDCRKDHLRAELETHWNGLLCFYLQSVYPESGIPPG